MKTSLGDNERANPMSCRFALLDILKAGRGYLVLQKGWSFAQVGGGPHAMVAEFRLDRSKSLWRVHRKRKPSKVTLGKIKVDGGVVYCRNSEQLNVREAASFLLSVLRGGPLPKGLGARDVWLEEMG